ncbi:MAG: DNA polymerase III subunit gamma/tau [Chloroflexi bacterium]|nr:DNA polymerase III subunit gamma/tau [Chloroflexota bacterium]
MINLARIETHELIRMLVGGVMPAQALYSKYRPRTFDEIEGQAHIKTTLKSALVLNRIAHAYLFTGPRGTGKTTTARVLAKAVNCLSDNTNKPCNQCAVCVAINEGRMLDLIEIDAASNTSVEDIRDLRDKVDFRPGEAKYKFYIVDECHMLSTSAFNALLKTLEEPPPHVIFVLATTDPQKIPATVISRTQRFDFRRLTLPEIIARLTEIAHAENLRVEPAAIDLIARQATGAMRDAISLLDQLTAYGNDEITLVQVEGLLGAASYQIVGEIVARLAEKDIARGLAHLANAVDSGADPRQLGREIVDYLRGVLLIQVGSADALTLSAETLNEMTERSKQFTPEQVLRAIRLFNQAGVELRSSAHPTLPLEMAFVEATHEERVAAIAAPVPVTPPRVTPPPPKPRAKPAATESAPDVSSATSTPIALSMETLQQNWTRILQYVRQYNKVAEALLRDAEPIKVEDTVVTLGFRYDQHAERFENQAKGKPIIEKAFESVFKQKCRVKCVLSPKKAQLKAVQDDPLIRSAVNQWGAEITKIHSEGAP